VIWEEFVAYMFARLNGDDLRSNIKHNYGASTVILNPQSSILQSSHAWFLRFLSTGVWRRLETRGMLSIVCVKHFDENYHLSSNFGEFHHAIDNTIIICLFRVYLELSSRLGSFLLRFECNGYDRVRIQIIIFRADRDAVRVNSLQFDTKQLDFSYTKSIYGELQCNNRNRETEAQKRIRASEAVAFAAAATSIVGTTNGDSSCRPQGRRLLHDVRPRRRDADAGQTTVSVRRPGRQQQRGGPSEVVRIPEPRDNGR